MGISIIKKSFSLIITIFLISIFSFLSIHILQTKSIQNKNIENQYLYIQANNHKEFLKKYLKNIDLSDINHLEISDNKYKIEAFIEKQKLYYKIDIFIKAKNHDIKIHEKVLYDNL